MDASSVSSPQSSGQEPEDSRQKAEDADKAVSPDVRTNFTFNAQTMGQREALEIVAKWYRVNIVISNSIPRRINPANELYDVTLEEAVRAICGTNLTYEIKDKFIYVYTNEEYTTMPKEVTLEMAKKAVAVFFAEKHKSISKFTPLEWGELTPRDNGTMSIRCKYELTSWGKDEKEILESMFFFDKTGKVDSLLHLREPVMKTSLRPGGEMEVEKQP